MFNFSVVVLRKVLKALTTFVGSFNFSSFANKVGACSSECTLSFLNNVPCCFYFVIRFCYKSTVLLLLSFFYDFA